MFSNLHSSLAPPKTRRSTSESPYGSTENLDTQGSFPTASEKKRRAPLPPIYPASTKSENRQLQQSQAAFRGASAKPAASNYLVPIREVENIEDTAMTGSGKRPVLPLPDYDSLFPQKRHGVQGQTRWDHIIAEVNQRQREYPPQLIGKEMCVDCPKEHPHIDKPSLMQERAAGRLNQQQTQPQEAQTTSWKKVGTSSMQAPSPPKPVAAASPRLVTVSNTRQDQSTVQVNSSVEQPNTFVLGSTDIVAPSKKSPLAELLENAKKVLPTVVSANDGKSVLPTEKPKTASRVVRDSSSVGDHKGMTINIPKEIPTARPRQRVFSKEPAREADPVRNEPAREADLVLIPPGSTTEEQENIRVTGAAMTDTLDMRRSSPVMAENTESDVDKKQERFTEPDPFSSGEALSEVHSGPDDLFTGRMQKDEEVEEQGMTPDDLDKIFMPENPTDPFSRFNNNDSEKQLEQKKTDYSNKSPALQRKKRAPQPPTNSDNSHMLTTTGSHKLELQQDATRQSNLYGTARTQIQAREEQLAADPFALSSSPMSVLAEPTSQPGVLSGGKSLLQAWVSPEVQPHAVISSNGGGPASTPRRPHPVKPMSSTESQPPISTPAVRELKTHESTPGKMKLTGTIVDSGPYTQLTQEELITLVVKQQSELSKKDTKIVELEEYIDNLLVRVMEEQPSILSSLTSAKQVL